MTEPSRRADPLIRSALRGWYVQVSVLPGDRIAIEVADHGTGMRPDGGNVSEAARALGLHRRSLQRKLAKFPSAR